MAESIERPEPLHMMASPIQDDRGVDRMLPVAGAIAEDVVVAVPGVL